MHGLARTAPSAGADGRGVCVEHFADQAAYDAHTSSPAYRDLIADQYASMIVEFTELDHELVVGL